MVTIKVLSITIIVLFHKMVKLRNPSNITRTKIVNSIL